MSNHVVLRDLIHHINDQVVDHYFELEEEEESAFSLDRQLRSESCPKKIQITDIPNVGINADHFIKILISFLYQTVVLGARTESHQLDLEDVVIQGMKSRIPAEVLSSFSYFNNVYCRSE